MLIRWAAISCSTFYQQLPRSQVWGLWSTFKESSWLTYKLTYQTGNWGRKNIWGSLLLTGSAHHEASYMCSKKYNALSSHMDVYYKVRSVTACSPYTAPIMGAAMPCSGQERSVTPCGSRESFICLSGAPGVCHPWALERPMLVCFFNSNRRLYL